MIIERFIWSCIEHSEGIIVGVDRDLSSFESIFYISLETIKRLSCLDTTLQFEYIELFFRVDFFFSFLEILFLLLYDDDFTLCTFTDAFTSFIESSGILSWHTRSIVNFTIFQTQKSREKL